MINMIKPKIIKIATMPITMPAIAPGDIEDDF
jgi:hypothetical protein